MKDPGGTRYVPGYDLFKLIVAVLLTVLLIVLLLQESQRRFALLEMKTTSPPTQPVPASPTLEPSSTPTPPPTSTSTSTATAQPVVTEAIPSPTSTEITAVESPTDQPSSSQPSSPDSIPASDPNECPSNPTRITAGAKVRVLDWLNFREGPGLYFPIRHTNRPGTELEVIGGPVCTVKGENPPTAYLWWHVRMADGREGWSAEAPLNFPNYFLEPVK